MIRETTTDEALRHEQTRLSDRIFVDRYARDEGAWWVYRGRVAPESDVNDVYVRILKHRHPAEGRLRRELAQLQDLALPGLVPLIAAGETAYRTLYTVDTPPHEGGNLRRMLEEGGPLPWSATIAVAIQLVALAQALRGAGVARVAFRLEDIVWCGDREHPVAVCVHPLSLAWLFRPPALVLLGAMPEEAASLPDSGPDGASEEVFRLAATLYELCTGHPPYADEPTALRTMSNADQFRDVPLDVEAAFARALDRDPARRLASFERMGAVFQALAVTHRIETRIDYLFAGTLQIGDVIDVGTTASIHQAWQRHVFLRPVALKLLLPGPEQCPDECLRLRYEGFILNRIGYRCGPFAYTVDRVGGRSYAVLHLLDGRPAEEFCRPDAHLEPPEVIEVGLQLVAALRAAHDVGVVHRDINPRNVLIHRKEAIQAHLIDFNRALPSEQFFAGFHASFSPTSAERRTMLEDVVVEDPRYSAPEVQTHRRFSPASDVYALGVLLHHLATGALPGAKRLARIKGGVAADALNRTLEQMLDPAADRRPKLPELHDKLTAGKPPRPRPRRHPNGSSANRD